MKKAPHGGTSSRTRKAAPKKPAAPVAQPHRLGHVMLCVFGCRVIIALRLQI